jgi:hypothetical protein
MGVISVTTFISDTETVTRTKLNGLAGNLVTEFNGNIDNNNIKANAGIVYSKLTLTGGIVNADINASAGIVDTKLATISTAGKVSGAALTSLANTPSEAGVIPAANLTSVAQKGDNSDITSLSGLTTPLGASQVGSLLGAWVDKSSSYGAQQAATDGFVVVYAKCDTSTVNTDITLYTDGNADPTTIRQKGAMNYPGANYDPMYYYSTIMPVKKSDYWKIICDQTHIVTWAVYWIPMGS